MTSRKFKAVPASNAEQANEELQAAGARPARSKQKQELGIEPSDDHQNGVVSGSTSLPDLNLMADSLGYSLKRALVRAHEVLGTILDENSISPARMTALSLIGMSPGISQSALAKELGINRASIVKVIDTLELKNFVERRATEGDRRSYSLTLTNDGLSELCTLQEQLRVYEKAIALNLRADERQQLMRLLEKVAIIDPGIRLDKLNS